MIVLTFSKLVTEDEESRWLCWLEVSQGGVTWMLPVTAPGDLLEEELQAHFEAQEDHLWSLAETKQYPPKVCGNVPTYALVLPLLLTLLDEINFLRGEQGHSPIAREEFVDNLKAHLRTC